MSERKPLTYEAALSRMASLCSRSEMCESEIRIKLHRAGMSAEETERVIDYLVERGFVDNARYARAFAADKSRFAGWGRNKIRMGLIAKHIDYPDISAALESIDHPRYAETLLKMARARSSGLDLSDRNDRAKLYRRLLSRGYESALVLSAIEHVAKEAEEDR